MIIQAQADARTLGKAAQTVEINETLQPADRRLMTCYLDASRASTRSPSLRRVNGMVSVARNLPGAGSNSGKQLIIQSL